MTRWPFILAAAALLPAASTDPLEGYAPAGPAAHCLSDSDLTPVILDDHTIGLHRTAKRWWVSRVDDCRSLQPISTLIVERFGGPLCDTDRFRVLEPGNIIPSGYCRFGPFTPYDKIPKPR